MGECLEGGRREEDFPGVPARCCGQCLEMWVRLAGSNVCFNWNYLFCQVEGGLLGMSKKYIRLQEKNLNEGGEGSRKEKLLNS